MEGWHGGEKGLRVNVGKTKVMRCQEDAGQTVQTTRVVFVAEELAQTPSNVPHAMHVYCVHKKCSGITGKLMHVDGYRCKRCIDSSPASLKMSQQISLGNGQSLECVEKFCYLGDMIAAGGGAGEASRARVSEEWLGEV